MCAMFQTSCMVDDKVCSNSLLTPNYFWFILETNFASSGSLFLAIAFADTFPFDLGTSLNEAYGRANVRN